MKTKERKELQSQYAQKNIEKFFSLLDTRFAPDFDATYVTEIQRLSQAFTLRLSREQKLKFCRNCKCYWNTQTRMIRFSKENQAKEYICKNCGFVRRFPYKKSSQ
ncbi:hypothetical protein H6501_05450 [Candidatus Woesearchaeota archaeon]|nr:hypothetical protein [Nanoarchaeota archaeon]MCB9371020.1 hypothetical protein [Candidatus Woesearchaeota archaeon]USN44131.1 MAG: hypothetical protein H6500_07125 [Candidatus Woesearchaeota archaeon]